MKKGKYLQKITYVVLLLLAIIIMFRWYTTQNRNRMEDRNKNYASDSARQTAAQIDKELDNGQNSINT